MTTRPPTGPTRPKQRVITIRADADFVVDVSVIAAATGRSVNEYVISCLEHAMSGPAFTELIEKARKFRENQR